MECFTDSSYCANLLKDMIKRIIHKILYILLITTVLVSFAGNCYAATIDRVVAHVNDYAITERELYSAHNIKLASGIKTTEAQTLETIINRMLIVTEALRLRIEGASEDELVREYISLKIRAFISIKDNDMRAYYNNNKSEFKGVAFDSIAETIRTLLEEETVNERLKRHLKILRKKSSISIMLSTEEKQP